MARGISLFLGAFCIIFLMRLHISCFDLLILYFRKLALFDYNNVIPIGSLDNSFCEILIGNRV